MKLYLDASVILPLFVPDVFSTRADTIERDRTKVLLVSDFSIAECASAVARMVRVGEQSREEAQSAFQVLDEWLPLVERVSIERSDVGMATAYLRRLDLTLRTADAIHLAAAHRLGAELATFDKRMAESARIVGVAVASI